MILRWHFDGNHWQNVMKIKCPSIGLYSLKNCHKPTGIGFNPPPPHPFTAKKKEGRGVGLVVMVVVLSPLGCVCRLPSQTLLPPHVLRLTPTIAV